jgi:hypothetical protein
MPISEQFFHHVLMPDLIFTVCRHMRGLCHNCYGSNLELVVTKGDIICQSCFEKKNAKN